jgi:hypothetical protein
MQFTREHLNTLNLGFQYGMEKHPKNFVNTLIIETENAIRQLDPSLQSAYRHLACKKVKQIKNTNYYNTSHKTYHHNLQQIKQILIHNNLSIVKADKGKAIVIIHTDQLQHKINSFMQDNNIAQLRKDPTELYQKKIQQAVSKSGMVISKSQQKQVTQVKPNAPHLNVLIKTLKQDAPTRPVINNRQAPAYRLAKFLNKSFNQMIKLPYTYALKNTLEIAQELTNLHINSQYRLATFDIKDLYVKLPIQDIVKATKFCLHKYNVQPEITQQMVLLIETVLTQNYFQHNNQYYKPDTGIAMGSPLSSTMTETYLQYLEKLLIKHWLESKEIIFYRRYVDGIFIVFDQNKIEIDKVNNLLNITIPHLEITYTVEENSTITYLDLSIQRCTHSLLLSIFRKPTQTDTTPLFTIHLIILFDIKLQLTKLIYTEC